MRLLLALCALGLAGAAGAEEADKSFTLAVPEALAESGLTEFLLPRFSLKTSTRIRQVAGEAEADARFGAEGVPVFEGPGQLWRLEVGPDPDAAAFADWLRSDVGQRTVESFEVDGAALFTARASPALEVVEVTLEGDAARGAKIASRHCGRCHATGAAPGMSPIGSTPSFRLLRGFDDWSRRFEGFYALNPHPAFTQIDEVTAPFDPRTPSPIVPVEMTLDEVSDVVAYVAGIAPADLGAPIESR